MGQNFLIDTNIVIDVLKPSMPVDVKNKIWQIPLIVSVVTYIETLGWHNATESELHAIQNFMDYATVIQIDKNIVEKTISIRQQKKIGLGDAIIAATALVNGLTVATRNSDDFKNIDNLQVWNPWL